MSANESSIVRSATGEHTDDRAACSGDVGAQCMIGIVIDVNAGQDVRFAVHGTGAATDCRRLRQDVATGAASGNTGAFGDTTVDASLAQHDLAAEGAGRERAGCAQAGIGCSRRRNDEVSRIDDRRRAVATRHGKSLDSGRRVHAVVQDKGLQEGAVVAARTRGCDPGQVGRAIDRGAAGAGIAGGVGNEDTGIAQGQPLLGFDAVPWVGGGATGANGVVDDIHAVHQGLVAGRSQR